MEEGQSITTVLLHRLFVYCATCLGFIYKSSADDGFELKPKHVTRYKIRHCKVL